MQRLCEDKGKFLEYYRLEYEEFYDMLRIVEGDVKKHKQYNTYFNGLLRMRTRPIGADSSRYILWVEVHSTSTGYVRRRPRQCCHPPLGRRYVGLTQTEREILEKTGRSSVPVWPRLIKSSWLLVLRYGDNYVCPPHLLHDVMHMFSHGI